jgi:hypothetical protein
MTRKVFIAAIALLLVSFGWVAGRSQASAPPFEFIVNAPSGETVVECVRGCDLLWVERGIPDNATPQTRFTYSCGAARCSSGSIGGWLTR